MVLDCGCGAGTITLGLAEAVPGGHVIGVDLDLSGLKGAQRAAISLGQQNVSWIGADGRSLPFHGAIFDAVLCHSMLETLDDPAPVIAELRRVTKRGGVVGAASVEYDGIILAGEPIAGLRRFYDIRQQLWRAARIAEPNTGQRLRGLFQVAGFGHVEAFADYISYGTRIGSEPSPRIEQPNAGIASCMPASLATGSPRQRSCLIWRQPGISGATIPPPSLPSRGVGCWPGASGATFVRREIDLAWNAPLAYVKIKRRLQNPCQVVAMRDAEQRAVREATLALK